MIYEILKKINNLIYRLMGVYYFSEERIVMTSFIERFSEDNEIAINTRHIIDGHEVRYNMTVPEDIFDSVIEYIKNKKKRMIRS